MGTLQVSAEMDIKYFARDMSVDEYEAGVAEW
jgi:hypothetical protein